ncbi:MAG: hypothetical protein PHC88_14895 [Terrimicrobiaceae bacterium]|nr:hypothetical protein [Terrimicrobiaceae bacterium]
MAIRPEICVRGREGRLAEPSVDGGFGETALPIDVRNLRDTTLTQLLEFSVARRAFPLARSNFFALNFELSRDQRD